MTDQNNSVSFNSIDDIDLTALSSPSEAPQVTSESTEVNVLSVNSNTNETTVPPITATTVTTEVTVKDVEDKEEVEKASDVRPVEEVTKVAFTPPELEAEIAEHAKTDKENGKTIELLNTLNGTMRELVDNIKNANPIGDNVKTVLDTLSFDPNNITIDNSGNDDVMLLHTQLELLKSVRPDPVFPIIALKSGYKADIAALNNNDKIELRNLTGSGIDQTIKLFKMIHGKIRSTSIGKISFTKFLEVTAEDDYETLVYGIFSASFPNATEYNMGCPHCRTEIKLPLFPSQLIEVIDKEKAGQYVAQVLEGYDKGEEFLKDSLVNKKTREILPKSKSVIEIITPSLQNMLDNMRMVERHKEKYSADLINLTKYISSLFVLNIDAYQATGRAAFLPVTEWSEILEFIANADSADLQKVRNSVSSSIRNYSIQYRIPNFICPSKACAKPIENIDIDLTKLLFIGIVEELSA